MLWGANYKIIQIYKSMITNYSHIKKCEFLTTFRSTGVPRLNVIFVPDIVN